MTEQHQQQSQKDHPLHHPKAIRVMNKVSRLSIKLSGALLLAVIFFVLVRLASPSKVAPPPQPVASNKVPTTKPTLSRIKFDLKGPLTCNYSSSEATVSAAILNKQIFVNVKEATLSANYLVQGDCLYTWNSLKPAGTKVCQLGSILQTVELVSSVGGGIDIETVLGALPSRNKALEPDTEVMNGIADSCIKVATDAATFTFPQNVTFIEEKAAE